MAEAQAVGPQEIGQAVSKISGIRNIDEEPGVIEVYLDVLSALGLDAGVFVSFDKSNPTQVEYRFLGCSMEFCRTYLRHKAMEDDVIVRYAVHHVEPCKKSQLRIISDDHQDLVNLAAEHGFASFAVFPSASAEGRRGVLYAGSRDPGYLEGAAFDRLCTPCQMLANELNEWIVTREKACRIGKSAVERS